MSERTPRPGRPQLMTRPEMREQAMAVLLRDGYDTVSMGDIARELGISVRTLHRHFPAKADLVWDGLDEAFDRLHTHLAEAPAGEPILRSIQRAMLASIDPGLRVDPLHRARLRLIATTTTLQEKSPERFSMWHDDIAAFTASRMGVAADAVAPQAIAAAIQAAGAAALSHWARQTEDRPPDGAIRSALEALATMTVPLGP